MKKLIFILFCLAAILLGTCSCENNVIEDVTPTVTCRDTTINTNIIEYSRLTNESVDTILLLNYPDEGDIVLTYSTSGTDSITTTSYTETEYTISQYTYELWENGQPKYLIEDTIMANYTEISDYTYEYKTQPAAYNIFDYVDKNNERTNPKYKYSEVWMCTSNSAVVKYRFTYDEWLTSLELKETNSEEYNKFMHEHRTK